MSRRAWLLAGAGLVALVACALADLLQGSGGIPAGTVLDALLDRQPIADHDLVHELRVPRAAAGALCGAALAAAAVLLQALARNPLAEPGTLGLSAGGALAVTAVTAFGGSLAGAPTILVAGGGVLLGALLIAGLSAAAGGGAVRVVLAGMAINLALAAGTAAVQLVRENETSGLFLWGAGSLLQDGWEQVAIGAAVAGPALALALLLGRALDVAVLGGDQARALGQRTVLARVGAGLLAVVLTAAAVGVAGPLAFAGLLAVAIARAARPRGHAAALLVAVPWGGAIVLGADVLGRLVLGADREVPAGVVCALAGAPVLAWLARRLDAGDGPALDRAAGSGRWRPAAAAVVVLLVPAAALTSLCLGELGVGPGPMLGAIFGTGDGLAELALELRGPRLAVALLAGACLAAAGTVLQATVRNPLASPELVGVTGGASVGAFLVLLALPDAPRGALAPAAFAGGLLALGAVVLLSGPGRAQPARLALVGLAVTAACAAITTLMVLEAQPAAAIAITWLAGSTYAQTWGDLLLLAVPAAVLVPLVLVSRRRLDLLALGDAPAASLGLPVTRARLLLLVAAAALASAAVAVTGAIAFVGLLAPHAARLVAGGEHRRLLPVAMAIGATLLAASDVAGRLAFAPTEVPAGLVVSLLGAPYVAWLMWRSRAVA